MSSEKTRPFYAETVRLGRTLTSPYGNRGHGAFPLELEMSLYEDADGVPTMKSRVYFPRGYSSPLVAEVWSRNEGEGERRPAMFKLDSALLPSDSRSSTKSMDRVIYIRELYSRPVMCMYESKALPHERAAVKGLGRILVCHAVRTWLTWAPRFWPNALPRSPAEAEVHLTAEGKGERCNRTESSKRRLHMGLGISQQARLVRYYESLGFSTTQRFPTVRSRTHMKARAADVLSSACDH